MRDRSRDEVMAEYYRDNPGYAAVMLDEVLSDEEATPGELLVVLRQMAKAFGGVQGVAAKASLNPTQMYRTLSAEGNPSLSSLMAILRAMGMRLAVQRIEGAEMPAGKPRAAGRGRKKPVGVQEGVASKVKAAR